MSETITPCAGVVRLAIAACLAAATLPLGAGQSTPPSAPPKDQPEITTSEEKATFTSHVNLVMVPVVVRDKNGRAVEGLTKDSFRLYDKGKLQEIERLVVERPGSSSSSPPPSEPSPPGEEAPAAGQPTASMPRRFIGYLFDDVHTDFADLAQVREAAQRHMDTELKPTDRAAIFTTSGQGTVDFTDDLGQLRRALLRLMPHPIVLSDASECISFYQADLIINSQDRGALQLAAACFGAGGSAQQSGFALPSAYTENLITAEAQRKLAVGEQETVVSLSVLNDVVKRMSAVPGERVLVLVSPGFHVMAEHHTSEYDLIERALRAKVVINALNPRGIYISGAFQASQGPLPPVAAQTRRLLERQTDADSDTTLMELTADTGGYYFHNNNDSAAGFRRTAAAPELYYVLGFQPQNLKLDGSFHALKVALEAKTGYTVEARRGYFAPTHLEDAAATAKREIEDAVYSREEMNDLPVQVHTQFFRSSNDAATVTVLAHIDLKGVKFRKENDRNLDNITVVSALFDRNGKVVTGAVKHVDLRLRDDSLQYRLAHGITVRMGLETKPGQYLVRLVVRDSEGQLMSATNGAVDIP